jgi:hypothetical protein
LYPILFIKNKHLDKEEGYAVLAEVAEDLPTTIVVVVENEMDSREYQSMNLRLGISCTFVESITR